MHPNPVYRQAQDAENLGFARHRGFGVLTINGDSGPLASHVPFLLSDDGSTVDLHLVRSNPMARALASARPALLAVSGPDSYVSPDWYGIDDQVPTWNYVAVHLRGTLELLPEDRLRDLLDRLSARFEAELAPKPLWTSAKMTPGVMERMMRQIVPARLTIAEVAGTWKLSQNKADAVRLAAADGVASQGIGQELAHLASLMRRG